jgi:hypothetical protein
VDAADIELSPSCAVTTNLTRLPMSAAFSEYVDPLPMVMQLDPSSRHQEREVIVALGTPLQVPSCPWSV